MGVCVGEGISGAGDRALRKPGCKNWRTVMAWGLGISVLRQTSHQWQLRPQNLHGQKPLQDGICRGVLSVVPEPLCLQQWVGPVEGEWLQSTGLDTPIPPACVLFVCWMIHDTLCQHLSPVSSGLFGFVSGHLVFPDPSTEPGKL